MWAMEDMGLGGDRLSTQSKWKLHPWVWGGTRNLEGRLGQMGRLEPFWEGA